ncbi:MAG: hypothetical protein AAF368_15965, partial [Planctomycetota bacterium]
FDACLIRTTWDYTERRQEFVDWAERCAKATRLLNGAATVKWNTDKRYLAQLEKLGVRLAPTRWIESVEDVSSEKLEGFLAGRKGFLKPLVGACASDTLPFDCDGAGLALAQSHVEAHISKSSMMLQPFLESVKTEGEYSFLYFGGEFSHAVRKVPVPGDYRVMDDFGATDEPYTPRAEELATSEGILSRLSQIEELSAEPLLYARVDYLRNDEGELCLNELELVEPSLFFRHSANAAPMLARALAKFLPE